MGKDKKQGKRYLIILVVILSVITAIVLSALIKSAIERAIYEERRESLVQLINTSARSINENIATQWGIADVYENDVKSHLSGYPTVEEYLDALNNLISDKNDYYFLVDSVGKYYCNDGSNGKINEPKFYLEDTEDKLEYLDSLPHLKNGVTYLILRTRLATPITVNSANGPVEIRFCCLMHDFSSVTDHINALFGNGNNIIIYDTDTGVMLYKQFGLSLLIDGYNVYDKFNKVDLVYVSDNNEVVEALKSRTTAVSAFDLNGSSYFLCSNPLNISNWSLLLVVAGKYFDSSTGQAFSDIIYAVTLILLVGALLIIALFWYFNKSQLNKRILENEKKINQALNEAYRTKSNFLSYMSHDIRTPINGIIGMSGIGTANRSDPEKVEDCFRKIALSGNHLLAIVNDVLDMSAIESGKVVLQSTRMDIVDTLKSCMDIIKGSLSDRSLNMEENYDCPIREVIGDEFHLKQIVINILSNAVKFTEDGGSVRISCRQTGENSGSSVEYEISISDTGIGMSEEFREHIFEAFKQANPNGRTKYRGTGLGMAISHEYVKLMNGSISVESRLGEGSTFTVRLPFEKDETESETAEPEKLNVLLVEDNEINAEITQEMLAGKVGSVRIAHDGKQALDAFCASEIHSFDLILMDIMMPVMNGLESARAIRASGRADSGIPIIALTANSYKDDIDAVFAAGMNGYLNKPFTSDQLMKIIQTGGRLS